MLKLKMDLFPTLKYKDFYLKCVSDFAFPFEPMLCQVQKDFYEERKRDEHGKLEIIMHKPETFTFSIAENEFVLENCSPEEVIYNRFIAEVDYYLGHKLKDKIEDTSNLFNFRYFCKCCGTRYTTNDGGYTPTCKNCGALMEVEELSNGIKR